ncbi:Uncharacterised protein family UPF0016 [Ostreococcus tauri]|uniref:GDT1 family protein n=1 Tax=Ostreococcus tauri TaxID=70448 RepID=A0A090M7D9_OSTTA|nr:Uncharacterised protein family UPF0016 [Ostreococcus tauri]CEF98009.1 Uncharacterised protein family UPF0016 [Ostreococcus tauri]|eukprot:XP_003079379.2 Uncharacterised protein family UPF0016 [Ostreococcus tauri]
MSTPFVEGFLKSSALVVLSEIGDKTFFIAALLAMRHARGVVFLGSWLALVVMTVLSAVVGAAVTTSVSPRATHNATTVLFFVFGARALRDSLSSGSSEDEDELAEVERELARKTRGGKRGEKGKRSRDRVSTVFAEAFAVTFLAEWGDRSQIATIGLAAQSDVAGVALGGSLGHALCTGVAVIGGRKLADRAQDGERVVGILGGVLFLCFGVHALVTGPP